MFFSFDAMERFVEQAENEENGYIPNNKEDEDEEQAMALLYGDIKEDDIDEDEPGSEDEEEGMVGEEDEDLDDVEQALEKALDKFMDDNQPNKQNDKSKKKIDIRTIKYDDWFAPAGQDRLSQLKRDEIEENIEAEFNELGWGLPAEVPDDNEKNLSTSEKQAKVKRMEIEEAEKILLEQDERDTVEEMSSFQRGQLKMQKKIKRLEEENLQQKHWKYSGETTASRRPLNSLLSQDIEYEQATKLAPVITDEVTKTLEDIIKYRIVENAFDDVIKKIMFEDKGDRRERGTELDSNKSKKSLAQIYEEDFQQKAQGVQKEDPHSEKQQEILRLFQALCEKLDAMSNTNFTPKQSKLPEKPANRPDLPAINMEEVTPITVSDASQLAPEEIFEKPEKLVQGETEKTKEDRKRERKVKKEKKKKRSQIVEQIQNQKAKVSGVTEKKEEDIKKGSVAKAVKQIKESGDRNVKFVTGSDSTNYSQSTALFKKLQEDAKKEANNLRNATASPQQNNKRKRDNQANNFKL